MEMCSVFGKNWIRKTVSGAIFTLTPFPWSNDITYKKNSLSLKMPFDVYDKKQNSNIFKYIWFINLSLNYSSLYNFKWA